MQEAQATGEFQNKSRG